MGEQKFKGGQYYCFGINIGGEVGGDMSLLVDKTTYKAYESSVDGYFGEYRGDNYDVFTYDMAVRKIEDEIGLDERRKYTLVDQSEDSYTIRVSFVTDPELGNGLYYVQQDFVGIMFENY